MLSQVVANMQCRYRAEWVKLLCDTRVVDLMYNNVEFVYLRKRVHFKLPSPLGVLSNPVDVVINALIILDEELI